MRDLTSLRLANLMEALKAAEEQGHNVVLSPSDAAFLRRLTEPEVVSAEERDKEEDIRRALLEGWEEERII